MVISLLLQMFIMHPACHLAGLNPASNSSQTLCSITPSMVEMAALMWPFIVADLRG